MYANSFHVISPPRDSFPIHLATSGANDRQREIQDAAACRNFHFNNDERFHLERRQQLIIFIPLATNN